MFINQRPFKPKTCAVVAMLKYLCMQSTISGNIQFGFYLSLDNSSNIFLFLGGGGGGRGAPRRLKDIGPCGCLTRFFL